MSNLPYIQSNNLITKIKQFFRKLFYKQEKNTIKKEIIEPVRLNNFKEELESKVNLNYSKQLEQDKFIEKIEKTPNLLYNLSLERLETLEQYYDDLIKEDEKKLEMLKKAV